MSTDQPPLPAELTDPITSAAAQSADALSPAELYLACTMRKETRGMGYPERLDASTLTPEDIAAYRRAYGTQHAPRPAAGGGQ